MSQLAGAIIIVVLVSLLLAWMVRNWATRPQWPAAFYLSVLLLGFGICVSDNLALLPLILLALPLGWFFAALPGLVAFTDLLLRPGMKVVAWWRARSDIKPSSRQIIESLLEDRTIETRQAEMLIGVVALHETQASQVMTALPALDYLRPEQTIEEALDLCQSSGHGRLPVLSKDQVIGIVNLHSLLKAYRHGSSLEEAINPVVLIPESYRLDKLIAYLQAEHKTVAMVIDEYGRPLGMVTIEDIIEEIVGQIDDETDHPFILENTTFVPGYISLDDLPELINGSKRPAVTSLGGLVFHLVGRLPQKGDSTVYNGHRLTVTSLQGNRIAQVKIEKI